MTPAQRLAEHLAQAGAALNRLSRRLREGGAQANTLEEVSGDIHQVLRNLVTLETVASWVQGGEGEGGEAALRALRYVTWPENGPPGEATGSAPRRGRRRVRPAAGRSVEMKNKDRAKKKGKGGKKDAEERLVPSPPLTRFGVVLQVPLDVKATTEAEARLIAVRWAVEALLDAKRPDEITAYPPLLEPRPEEPAHPVVTTTSVPAPPSLAPEQGEADIGQLTREQEGGGVQTMATRSDGLAPA